MRKALITIIIASLAITIGAMPCLAEETGEDAALSVVSAELPITDNAAPSDDGIENNPGDANDETSINDTAIGQDTIDDTTSEIADAQVSDAKVNDEIIPVEDKGGECVNAAVAAVAEDGSANESEGDSQDALAENDSAASVGEEPDAVEITASETALDTAVTDANAYAGAAAVASAGSNDESKIFESSAMMPAQSKVAKRVAQKTGDAGSYLIHNAVYQIASALSGKYCLTVANPLGKKKTNVVLQKKKTLLTQYWRAIYRGDGIYRFKSFTGSCYLAYARNIKQRANVFIAKSGTIDWKLKKNADGTFSLSPATKKKAFMSVANAKARAGANVQLWPSISNKGQKFTFAYSKRLTKAFNVGKTANPGIVRIAPTGSSVRVAIAGSSVDENAKAALVDNADAPSQVFQLRYRGNGLYEFQNAGSFKFLSVYGKSKKIGTPVVQTDRTYGLEQAWYLQKDENGYRIVSAFNGLVLDVKSGKTVKGNVLQVEKGSSSPSQVYEFSDAQLVKNGTYLVQSAMAMPFVLSVKSDKKASKNVALNRSAGVASEKFKFKHLGDGIYRITAKNSKKSIAAAEAIKKNGVNVLMQTSKNVDVQKWVIELGEQGFTFKNVATGKYLNVSGSQAKNGANVEQRTHNNMSNQSWALVNPSWSYYAGVGNSAMKLIKKAESYEGWRYKWGGRSPSTSFDCAGLVMYCSNKAWKTHFDLMYTNAEMLYGKCKHIKASQAKPGDLVFYRGTYGSDVNYISHVVIYTGFGYMFGAGDPIGYAKVNSIKNIKGKTAKAVYARIRH